MSHLIEEYAKNLGVKISKPIVSKHFFPIAAEKYITICCDKSISSRYYKHFDLVLNFIKQYLSDKGISVFQIGSSNDSVLPNVNASFLGLPFKNIAYIVSKSLVHIGSDEVFSHYANSVGVPLVTLFGHCYANNSNGYWNKNQINIEAPWDTKPCFMVNDPKDFINKIKPEDVANAILKQLNIGGKLNIKTKHMGNIFDMKIFEIVPNYFRPSIDFQDKNPFIRLDLGYDSNCFVSWINYLKKFSIFSDKPIDINVLAYAKEKITNILFIIKNENTFFEEYLEEVKKLNIPFSFIVEDKNKLNYYRNIYFDYRVDLYDKSSREALEKDFNFENCYFISSKIIFADDTMYQSKYHFMQKNDIDKTFKFVDNEVLLEELMHFYVYERSKQ